MWNVWTEVQNRNASFAVRNAGYVFEVYDKDNKLIAKREGSTYLPPNKSFLIS